MGDKLNHSVDKYPHYMMSKAAKVVGKYVKWNGGLTWDFEPLFTMPIDPDAEKIINSYLEEILNDWHPHKGWKIPETTLVYPWIARMFPETKFIHWIRDPRDCIRGSHETDDLRDFNIDYPQTDNIYEQRAISWIYQYQLMKATPPPKHVIKIRFEDFILNQDNTLKTLEHFLGIPLARIVVHTDAVARWKRDPELPKYDFDFLKEAILENGYPLTPT